MKFAYSYNSGVYSAATSGFNVYSYGKVAKIVVPAASATVDGNKFVYAQETYHSLWMLGWSIAGGANILAENHSGNTTVTDIDQSADSYMPSYPDVAFGSYPAGVTLAAKAFPLMPSVCVAVDSSTGKAVQSQCVI